MRTGENKIFMCGEWRIIMNTFLLVLVCVLPVIGLAVSVAVGKRTLTVTRSARKAFTRHFITVVLALVLCLAFTMLASAETAEPEVQPTVVDEAVETATESSSGAGIAVGMGFLAAAVAIGLAAVGAGMALAAGAPAAIGAVAEDPKSFGKSMIFVVLGEALAIYGFIVAFFIIMKLPTIPAV